MANIIPKLNLNKTPYLVENNSLIFAKNIRLDVDGTIHKDYGIMPLSLHKNKNTLKYNDYSNILNRIINDFTNSRNILTNEVYDYYDVIIDKLKKFIGNYKETTNDTPDNPNIIPIDYKQIVKEYKEYEIVGVISASNEFYIFINCPYTETIKNINTTTNEESIISTTVKNSSQIVVYDETTDTFSPCNCNWTYSGGTIAGNVINNLLGEKILNIGETNTSTLVPLKSINLSKSSIYDDATIYTQTPNIPITNLNYVSAFSYIIPNGVYQFFIRYKIRDNFYTDWFPASKELFAGNSNIKNTSFGRVKYVNTHTDADSSFTFDVEHLFPEYNKNYESFQIGFILSHDDSIVARAWKHFNFNVNTIYFDYDAKDAQEIEIIDLTSPTYQIYNVGNITNFKNKLYISNYIETNFNEKELKNLADNVNIKITTSKPSDSTYGEYELLKNNTTGLIEGIYVNETPIEFSYANGIFNKLLSIGNTTKYSAEQVLTDALGENKIANGVNFGGVLYGFSCGGVYQDLDNAKSKLDNIKKNKDVRNFNSNTGIVKISVNDIKISSNTVKDIISTIIKRKIYLNNSCKFINSSGFIAESYKVEIERGYSYDILTSSNSGIIPINPNGGIIQRPGDGPLNPGGPVKPGDMKLSTNQNNTTGTNITSRHVTGTYTQTININFRADVSKYNKEGSNSFITYSTLMPYQRYKFFIHYVKQSGEVTNGYYCSKAGILEAPYKTKVDGAIHPVFENVVIPEGYVACFFSILHVANKSATVFNIEKRKNSIYETNCLDINLGLFAANKNITVKQGATPLNILQGEEISPLILDEYIINSTGKYYYSSDSSNIRYFGADGIVTFDSTPELKNDFGYAVNDYQISEAEDVQLIKCTPFISSANSKILTLNQNDKITYELTYDSFANMNLLSYICNIEMLDRLRTIRYYSDGSSVYFKGYVSKKENSDEYEIFVDGDYLRVTELTNYLGDSKITENNLPEEDKNPDNSEATKQISLDAITIMDVNSPKENNNIIYSNYNLNYLGLVEDPVETFKTYYNTSSDSTSKDEKSTNTMVLRLFKSLTMSNIYELPSMYKSYTRKTYSVYTPDETIKFDNTVRSSVLEEDETSINLYKFNATDYYNVPTSRGIITNMLAMGDAILVHTKDSLFKFSGSNNLQSTDGEIQMVENQPFDTGIVEIFDSEYGFAGLQNKNDSIVTEYGYIFFDRDSNIVYLYSGQTQLVKLSDSIEKLFRHKPIKSIHFANDCYNNRFFMTIIFIENYITTIEDKKELVEKQTAVTLSFNLLDQVKSFVSLHDFYFYRAFNTKSKCYFITRDAKDICTIDKNNKGCYSRLQFINDSIYPSNYRKELLTLEDNKKIELYKFDTILDVIVNTNYESIKTLNAINWCSGLIDKEFEDIDSNNIETLKMAEDYKVKIVNSLVDVLPCRGIRIYSDSCISPLYDFIDNSNNTPINSTNNYKYPRYNQGFWTFNYFRNIQNDKHKFLNNNKFNLDNNSLIEGKYFVIRFIFDKDFKLETITLNYDNK